MSKISLIIKEAKIINTENSKPTKHFNKDTQEFKYLNFDICPIISKKNAKGEWENKPIYLRCTILNERSADRLLNSIKDVNKSYITIIDSFLYNIHVEDTTYTTSNGNEYKTNVYSYITITVNDFTITYGKRDEVKISQSKDTKESTESNPEYVNNDFIPF